MVSIADHGIIGNCRTAALVAVNGDIDWFCTPDFGSPSVFASLLDPLAGGLFSLQPTEPFRSRQRYLPSSPVLETRFETDGGSLVVTDLMPVASEDEKRRSLYPEHEILRIVRCDRGAVEIEVRYAPRPGMGQVAARLSDRGRLGIVSERRGYLVHLRSDMQLELASNDSEAHGRRRLAAGERVMLSLASCTREPMVLVPLGDAAGERLESTLDWWRDWVGRCKYHGNYPESVLRSLITLKLLSFAPSGAIVAAPTTSLPEIIGGGRNLALSIILVGSQQLGWTRISLPLMVGTAVTADRDRAIAAGTAIHLLAGLGFALIYAQCFELWSLPWWAGPVGGLIHGLAVLLLLLPVLPGIHPRMASERRGPEPTAALEPPGIFARNYGRATGWFALLGHLVYGLIFGIAYVF